MEQENDGFLNLILAEKVLTKLLNAYNELEELSKVCPEKRLLYDINDQKSGVLMRIIETRKKIKKIRGDDYEFKFSKGNTTTKVTIYKGDNYEKRPCKRQV